MLLMSPATRSEWAQRLSTGELALGDAFAFLSGLYFRGKLAYAQHFAAGIGGGGKVLIITPTRGLQRPESLVTREMLLEFAGVDLATAGDRYRGPLLEDARRLQAQLSPDSRVVLLGSIATAKYVAPLAEAFGDRLLFPAHEPWRPLAALRG
jgi:hypothetical protein